MFSKSNYKPPSDVRQDGVRRLPPWTEITNNYSQFTNTGKYSMKFSDSQFFENLVIFKIIQLHKIYFCVTKVNLMVEWKCFEWNQKKIQSFEALCYFYQYFKLIVFFFHFHTSFAILYIIINRTAGYHRHIFYLPIFAQTALKKMETFFSKKHYIFIIISNFSNFESVLIFAKETW